MIVRQEIAAGDVTSLVGSGIEFEWDELKASANLKKHGVSFEEAKTVFDNPLAVIFDNEAHSIDDQREIIIGRRCIPRIFSLHSPASGKYKSFLQQGQLS